MIVLVLLLSTTIIYFVVNFIDIDQYKQTALDKIKQKTDLKIEFVESNVVLFPYPGIELNTLTYLMKRFKLPILIE